MVIRKSQKIYKSVLLFVMILIIPMVTSAQLSTPSPRIKPIRKIDKYILPPSKQKVRINRNIQPRYPTNGRSTYTKAVRSYRNRLIAEKKRKLARINGQEHRRYQQRYNDVQDRSKKAEEARKAAALATAQTEAAPKQEPQLTPQQQRTLQNKEILEGKKDPVVQDDPNYLKFIEEKTQLTQRSR